MATTKALEDLLDKFKTGILEASQNKLGDLESKEVMLYGAGNLGKKLYNTLKENKIEVTCFIDRYKFTESGKYPISVYHPENPELIKWKESGYVILSALFSLNLCHTIKEQLAKIGFKNVFALHEVNFSIFNNSAFYETLFDGSCSKVDILGADKVKILESFSLLETEQDKELFMEFLRAHLTMDFTRFKDPYDISLQYLAHDIPIEKNYSHFIDCGGYDGDTLRNLISHGIKIENLVVFEPQKELHLKIAEYVRQNPNKFGSAVIFPCGVHSQISKFRFSISDDAPSAAKIDEQGNNIIQCVAIDEALQGFKPTFIKMDIEGAEIEALKGAKQTIREYHPQLAICVYHRLSDLWEIPLLIRSFYQGYRFYLRSYNFMGLETVLYAFPQ